MLLLAASALSRLRCAPAGLAETLVRAAEAVHPDLHGLLYSNVLLTGVRQAVRDAVDARFRRRLQWKGWDEAMVFRILGVP